MGGDGNASGDGGFVRSNGEAGWVKSGSTGTSAGAVGAGSLTGSDGNRQTAELDPVKALTLDTGRAINTRRSRRQAGDQGVLKTCTDRCTSRSPFWPP